MDKQNEPYASCLNCIRRDSKVYSGCNWRSAEIMSKDISPCLIWEDGKDN